MVKLLAIPAVLLLCSLAFGALAAWAVWDFLHTSGTSFLGPGQVTFSATKPGSHTLYQETRSLRDGKLLIYPRDLPSGLSFNVTNLATGQPIQLNTGISERLRMNEVERYGLARMHLPSAGEYSITISGLSEQRAFYLSESVFFKFFSRFFTGLFFSIASFVGAIGWFVYHHSRRHRPPLQTLRPL